MGQIYSYLLWGQRPRDREEERIFRYYHAANMTKPDPKNQSQYVMCQGTPDSIWEEIVTLKDEFQRVEDSFRHNRPIAIECEVRRRKLIRQVYRDLLMRIFNITAEYRAFFYVNCVDLMKLSSRKEYIASYSHKRLPDLQCAVNELKRPRCRKKQYSLLLVAALIKQQEHGFKMFKEEHVRDPYSGRKEAYDLEGRKVF